MKDNVWEKEMDFYKLTNSSPRIILKRNKQLNLLHSYSSKNNNFSFENKSGYIKSSDTSILNNIRKINKTKINQIITPKMENRYSNEKLFSNRISKCLLFYNKMLAKKKKNLQNNIILKLQKRKFNFIINSANRDKNTFLFKRKLQPKKINFSTFEQKINPNFVNPIFTPINRNKKHIKHSTIYFPRINSASSLSPKTGSRSFEDTYTKKKREKEKEKNIINENLVNLLNKIKQRILPKKKLNFEKNKLPDINNIKFKRIKPCIHIEENLEGKIEFIKTHLDGLTKSKKGKNKPQKRYGINKGYIDLEFLGDGNNVSFKTDLMEKNGEIYYEFNKNGRLETIEGKIHKVYKDNKEFIKLLQKYKENEVFKAIKAKDFEIIKKNYGSDSVLLNNNNIYRDLYHMIFRNKNRYLEMQKPELY